MATRPSRTTREPTDTSERRPSYKPTLNAAEREAEREIAGPSVTTLQRRHQAAIAELESEIDFLVKKIRMEMSVSNDLKLQVKELSTNLQAHANQLREAEEILHRQDISLSKQRQWNQRLESENVHLSELYDNSTAENRGLKSTLRSLEKDHASQSSEAVRLRERLRVLTDTRKAAADEETQLKIVINNLREDLVGSRHAASEAEQKLADLTRRMEQIQRQPAGPKVVYFPAPAQTAAVEEGEEDGVVPEGALREVKLKLRETERDNLSLRNAIRHLEIDIQAVHNLLSKADQAKKRLQAQNEELKERLKDLEQEGEELRSENKRLLAELQSDARTSSLATDIEKLKGQLDHAAKQQAREAKEKEQLEAQVVDLKRKIHTLEQMQIAPPLASPRLSDGGLTPISENRQRAKEIQELQDKLSATQRDEREKGRSLEQLHIQISSLNADLIKVRAQVTAAEEMSKRELHARMASEKSLSDVKHELHTVKQERDKAAKHLGDREAEIEAKQREIQRVSEELKQTKEKLALHKQLAQTTPGDGGAELQKRLEEKQALQAKLGELQLAHTQLTSHHEKMKEEHRKLQDEVEEKERTAGQMKETLQALTDAKQSLQDSERSVRAELERLRGQMKASDSDSGALQAQLDQTKASLAAATKHAKQTEEDLHQAEGKLTKAAQAQEALEGLQAKLRAQLADLTAAHKSAQAQAHAAEAALSAAKGAAQEAQETKLAQSSAQNLALTQGLQAELKATADKLHKAQQDLTKEAGEVKSLTERLAKANEAAESANATQRTLAEAQARLAQESKSREALAVDLKRMQALHTELLKKQKDLHAQLAEAQKQQQTQHQQSQQSGLAQPQTPVANTPAHPQSPPSHGMGVLPTTAPTVAVSTSTDATVLKAEADKAKTEAAQLKKLLEEQKLMTKRLSDQNKKLLDANKQAQAAQKTPPPATTQAGATANAPKSPAAGNASASASKAPWRRFQQDTDAPTRKLIVVQSFLRGKLARKEFSRAKHRAKVVRELTDTEKSYLATVEGICKCFLQPLQHLLALNEPMIAADEMPLLFSTIEQIYFSQQQVLKLFQDRLAKWNATQTIGDVVLRILDEKLLQPHVEYIQKFSQISESRIRLMKDVPAFNLYVKMSRPLPGVDGKSLEDMVITPVQRIPRYKLLLADLLKHTPASHPDHANLTRALTGIDEFAAFINENNRRAETLASVSDRVEGLSEVLSDNAERRLLFEGRLVHILDGKRIPRYGFIFSDCVAFTKESSKKKRMSLTKEASTKSPYKMQVLLKFTPTTKVENVPQFDGKPATNVFLVSMGDNLAPNVFQTGTEEEKQKWIDVITATLPRPLMQKGSGQASRKKLVKRDGNKTQ